MVHLQHRRCTLKALRGILTVKTSCTTTKLCCALKSERSTPHMKFSYNFSRPKHRCQHECTSAPLRLHSSFGAQSTSELVFRRATVAAVQAQQQQEAAPALH